LSPASADLPNDLISVVVPAHNAGRFLQRALVSVAAQSHRNLEVVVVDDGSTDGTAEIVSEAAAADTRFRLVRTGRQGVSAARNRGIAETGGRWIATLDADDLWHPDKLTRQLRLLREAPEGTGVAYCWASGIDEDDRVVLPVWNPSRAEGDVLREIVISGILSNGSTPLMLRSAVEAVGGYDEELDLAEDWKFYTALAGVCRFAVIPECLTGYRIYDESASVNVKPMEAALGEVTAWIRRTWPKLDESVFRERAYTIDTYLAFLSIRAKRYSDAMRYLARAWRGRPQSLFELSLWQFVALMIGHAAGMRRYRWRFWKSPPSFPEK
jgi:glycosyltransferase involved in cell wall biosynthesis